MSDCQSDRRNTIPPYESPEIWEDTIRSDKFVVIRFFSVVCVAIHLSIVDRFVLS